MKFVNGFRRTYMASSCVSGDLKPGPGGSNHPKNSPEAGLKPPNDNHHSSDSENEPKPKKRAIDPQNLFQQFDSLESDVEKREFYKTHLRGLNLEIRFPCSITTWLRKDDLSRRQSEAKQITQQFRDRLEGMDVGNWDVDPDPNEAPVDPPTPSSTINPPNQTHNLDPIHYPRFLQIRSTQIGSDFKGTNPFLLAAGVRAVVGNRIKNIKVTASGQLLAEVDKFSHAKSILAAKEFLNLPVNVQPHSSLNSRKGVIKLRLLMSLPPEEIMHHINETNPSVRVTNIHQIQSDPKDDKTPTGVYILTFAGRTLPEKILADYYAFNVTPYIQKPMQCFYCQRFGHSSKHCKSQRRCVRCSKEYDPDTEHACDEADPTKCANCGEPHKANYNKCSFYIKNEEILHIKETQNVDFKQARALYEQRHPAAPTQVVSTADIVRRTPNNTSQTIPATSQQCQNCVSAGTPTGLTAENIQFIQTLQKLMSQTPESLQKILEVLSKVSDLSGVAHTFETTAKTTENKSVEKTPNSSAKKAPETGESAKSAENTPNASQPQAPTINSIPSSATPEVTISRKADKASVSTKLKSRIDRTSGTGISVSQRQNHGRNQTSQGQEHVDSLRKSKIPGLTAAQKAELEDYGVT